MLNRVLLGTLLGLGLLAYGQAEALLGLGGVLLGSQLGWGWAGLGRRLAALGAAVLAGLAVAVLVLAVHAILRPDRAVARQTAEVQVRLQGLSAGTGARWGQAAQVIEGPSGWQGRAVWLELPFAAAADWQQQVARWQPGALCRLVLQGGPVYAPANPGTFDRERWLRAQGITVQGQVRAGQCREPQALTALERLDRWRGQLREHFGHFSSPARGVLLGLLTGDRALIDPALRDRYQQMGISHLLAISGPHVLLLAGVLTALLTRLLDFFPHLYLRQERRRWQLPLWMALVVGYALLAGWDIPAQRSALMAVLAGTALWLRQHWPRRTVVLAVAVLMAVGSPEALWSAAFWLSFGALVVVLGWSAQQAVVVPGQRWSTRLADWGRALWRSQVAMTMLLLPLVLVFFGQFSLPGLLVNLLAIPLLGTVVLLLNLFGLLLWTCWPRAADAVWALALQVLDGFHAGLDGVAQGLSALHWPLLWPVSLTPLALLALAAAVGLWLCPRGVVSRGWVIPLGVLALADAPVATGQLRLTVLDVPQAQGLVVQTARHALLLDGGAASAPNAAGAGRTAQVLQALGVRRLDRILLSIPDPRWSGEGLGLAAQQGIPWWTGQTHWPAGSPAQGCQAGQHWQWDGVAFAVLAPFAQDWQEVGVLDRVCVWRMDSPPDRTGQRRRVLVLGAAGTLTQQVLLLTCADLQADVLVSGGQPVLPELLARVGATHWIRLQAPQAFARGQRQGRGAKILADEALRPDLHGSLTVQVSPQQIQLAARRADWPWLLYPVLLEPARNPFTGAVLWAD